MRLHSIKPDLIKGTGFLRSLIRPHHSSREKLLRLGDSLKSLCNNVWWLLIHARSPHLIQWVYYTLFCIIIIISPLISLFIFLIGFFDVFLNLLYVCSGFIIWFSLLLLQLTVLSLTQTLCMIMRWLSFWCMYSLLIKTLLYSESVALILKSLIKSLRLQSLWHIGATCHSSYARVLRIMSIRCLLLQEWLCEIIWDRVI